LHITFKVYSPTQYKNGFNHLAWYKEAKPNTTEADTHKQNLKIMQHKINMKKLKSGLVFFVRKQISYDPGWDDTDLCRDQRTEQEENCT